MKGSLLISLIVMASSCLGNEMSSAHSDGNSFGKQHVLKASIEINVVDPQSVTPHDMSGQTFNPHEAKNKVKNGSLTSNSNVEFLLSKEVQNNRIQLEDDYLFKCSEDITDQSLSGHYTSKETIEFTTETCQQADAPYPVSCTRTLNVHVIHHPEELGEVKICQRHEYKRYFQSEKDAKAKVKDLRALLSRDPTIKWYQVDEPKGGGALHRYCVEAHWNHNDDTLACDHYGMQLRVIKEAWLEEEGDEWLFEKKSQESYLKDPNCTFYEKSCLDATPSKIINGKEVSRQCWQEKITFLCSLKSNLDCLTLKEKNCEFVKKECLIKGPIGCSLWELTFRCQSKILKRKVETGDLFGLDEELWQIEYDPNTSFADISMKLAVFESMQQDISVSQESDPRRIHVFTGKTMTCSKNVADDLMYDCCFSYSGLAKDLYLASCSKDELALAEMREKGLCHYVGSYSKKFLELWKSRDEHVYCCFSSKLARVFQEQARQQLGIGWGDPEEANPRGLTIDEISHLNFQQLDLREAFSDLEARMTVRAEEKLGEFQEKIRQKIKGQENET